MKVTVTDMPKLTPEEIEHLKSGDIPDVSSNPAEFKKQMIGVNEVIIPQEVADQLAEMGMTPDDLVAMLLKQSGTSN